MIKRMGIGFVAIFFIFALMRQVSAENTVKETVGLRKTNTTEWGWPLPYDQVSQKSIDWLKSKGWWPLVIGYFADAPGFSASYAIIKEKQLLEKRGLSVKFMSFLSGPPIVEAFLGGQTQVTHYGSFPFWLTVNNGGLVKVFALTAVNSEVAMIVSADSQINKPEDLKNTKKIAVVGTTLGSYAEFYLTAMAKDKGLVRDKDFTVAGLSMRDAQLLPKGTDAVVLWDPHIVFAIEKSLGRKIADGYANFFSTGYDFVRKEIHENAPDVVQLLTDAAVEALLYARYDLDGATEFYCQDPRMAAYPVAIVRDQIAKYLTFYPPTFRYIHKDFWVAEDSSIIKTLYAQGRMKRDLSVEEMKEVMAPEYMANTFHKLGWSVPEAPVFLPEKWPGKLGAPPYPEYIIPKVSTVKEMVKKKG